MYYIRNENNDPIPSTYSISDGKMYVVIFKGNAYQISCFVYNIANAIFGVGRPICYNSYIIEQFLPEIEL